MPASVLEIKDRLAKIIDDNGSVRDMASASEAISILEHTSVTKEELERTRLGLYVNKIRKASRNSPLAKRAKNLIKSWQQMIDGSTPQPLRRVQQARPETPNSVGSSPSPPEPTDYNSIPSYASPQLPQRPRSATPTSEGKKSRKHKSSATRKRDIPDGALNQKGQSLEVKDKQSLDTGQKSVSVKPNGLILTIKTQPSMQETVADSNKSHVPTLKRSQTDSKLSVHHKTHKKKKGHKSPHKTSSPNLASSATERITQQKQDAYNNNNNSAEFGMKSSKSASNVTVLSKTSSISKSSYNSFSNLESASHNLKRKRDTSKADTVSPERSDKPRAPKERRLTYDPLTGELKQVPKEGSPASITQKSSEKNLISKPVLSQAEEIKGSKSDFSSSPKTKKENKQTGNKETKIRNFDAGLEMRIPTFENRDAVLEISDDSSELPSRLSPSVDIVRLNSSLASCSTSCSSSSNFYESRREFKKRKTRRKIDGIDLPNLYPVSSLVETLQITSESDSEVEENGKTFCGSITNGALSSSENTHSSHCTLPGVTGCHGNNGSWYDWTEVFCVRNHQNSVPLPNEDEIAPLQILPYVELD